MNQRRRWREYTQSLIACAGGAAFVAACIGRSRAAVYAWERVPPELVEALEDCTERRITRYHWRPDLFDVPERASFRGRAVPALPADLRATLAPVFGIGDGL